MLRYATVKSLSLCAAPSAGVGSSLASQNRYFCQTVRAANYTQKLAQLRSAADRAKGMNDG